MYRNAFQPGDAVAPGLYWVHHYQHRLAHLCRIWLAHFPACARCGDKVRFTVAETGSAERAPLLRFDTDFRETSTGIPLQDGAAEHGASA